ncbi:GGDEF domain-containing phosphodiesterase [Kurthia sibirica]|uniref:GGDEF-domain containing protein n=1 Tax=Kurthia sibirica TaxID=202750 RepID=A0A2U3AQG6_9BACL|nr:GGDEF domain-containing phosphodiesterase [Kurthia sibirica]PWI26746.1 GGDEF-domain containing protein [Kurthia sibirica]GEK32724.1 GGDEF domain-containing protein [Kurthia sibirica]
MYSSPLDTQQWKNVLQKINLVSDGFLFFLMEKVEDDFIIHSASKAAYEQFGCMTSSTEYAKDYFDDSVWHIIMRAYEEQKHMGIHYQEKLLDTTIHGKVTMTLLEKIGNLYMTIIYTTENAGMSPLSKHNLDPIIGISQYGDILYSNKATTGTLGYRQQSIEGQNVKKIIHFTDEQTIEGVLEDIQLKKEALQFFNCQIIDVHGKKIDIIMKMIPVIVEAEIVEIQCIWRNIKEDHEEDLNLHYLSYHDQLTGVWNKLALQEHYLEESLISQEQEHSIALMLVDINRFKRINESYGTVAGDEILMALANRLKKIETDTRFLYRLNGDEFIFLLSNTTKGEIEMVVNLVAEIFSKPFLTSSVDIDCDYSIGIAIQANHPISLETMIHQTVQAIYFVRLSGEKNHIYYEEKMANKYRNNALMEGHLRRAIEKDELTLQFQPQIDLKTGKVESFEALLRWNNPHFGAVSPGQFIPIAEESGLIVGIGDWVLEEVAKKLEVWSEKEWNHLRIAVNISPRQFKELHFVQKMEQILQKYPFNPSMLELEITESSMTDVEQTLKILTDLKRMKIIISIDDFGTGYSSLSYIKSYPIDIIKIDQSFITEMDRDLRNQAIAKTIIHLAHSLGMTVIAEGVERVEHVMILQAEKCEKAQGFLFSRPIAMDEIEKKYIN